MMQDRMRMSLLVLIAVALWGLLFKSQVALQAPVNADVVKPTIASDASVAVTNDDHVYLIRNNKILVYDYSGLFVNLGQPAKNPRYIGSWNIGRRE
jgi:hypothetical protein